MTRLTLQLALRVIEGAFAKALAGVKAAGLQA